MRDPFQPAPQLWSSGVTGDVTEGLLRMGRRGFRRRSRWQRPWVVAGSALFWAGCGSQQAEEAGPDHAIAGQMPGPGGSFAPFVRSASGRAVEPEMRVDGWADTLELSQWVAVSSEGWVVLPQSGSKTLRIYDHQGNRMGVLGGDGEGPGEFRSVGSAQTVYGSRRRAGWLCDTLWVWDQRLARMTHFSPDMEVARVYTPSVLLRPRVEGAGGTMLTMLHSPRAVYPDQTILWLSSGRGADGQPRTGIVRVSQDASQARIIGWLPPDRGHADDVVYVPGFPSPVDDVSPDGRLIGMGLGNVEGDRAGSFVVTLISHTGDTLFSRDYESEPVHLSEERIRELRVYVRERQRQRREAGQGRGEVLLPGILSPLNEIILGNDTTVWLRVPSGSSQRKWLLLSKTGDPLDTFFLPQEARLKVARKDHLWVTVTDDWGVQNLIRYRIEPG